MCFFYDIVAQLSDEKAFFSFHFCGKESDGGRERAAESALPRISRTSDQEGAVPVAG